jgi:hypothetical protein
MFSASLSSSTSLSERFPPRFFLFPQFPCVGLDYGHHARIALRDFKEQWNYKMKDDVLHTNPKDLELQLLRKNDMAKTDHVCVWCARYTQMEWLCRVLRYLRLHGQCSSPTSKAMIGTSQVGSWHRQSMAQWTQLLEIQRSHRHDPVTARSKKAQLGKSVSISQAQPNQRGYIDAPRNIALRRHIDPSEGLAIQLNEHTASVLSLWAYALNSL